MTTSLLTLGAGREAHITNLVRGLRASTHQPDELVVAVMQDREYDLPQTDFPVRQIFVGGEGLQLARARNLAADSASGDILIFLDIDCIPAPDLVADYVAAVQPGGIYMGEVRYLPSGATDVGIDWDRFDAVSVQHSERAGPPTGPIGACTDYRCFWSLNFALFRRDYLAIGGFDETYSGYGGEDTDFGRSAAEQELDFWWVKGARAYHQYHPHHMPPVHHLDSVLANSERFCEKWGHHTMEHWLRCFHLMGLAGIRDGKWQRLRETRADDLALTRQQEDQPYASSARVLDMLERGAMADA